MVTRINVTEDPYVNIFQLVYIFCVVELHYAMSKVYLYNEDKKEWNIRNLFWYSIVLIPLAIAFLLVCAASIAVLVKLL